MDKNYDFVGVTNPAGASGFFAYENWVSGTGSPPTPEWPAPAGAEATNDDYNALAYDDALAWVSTFAPVANVAWQFYRFYVPLVGATKNNFTKIRLKIIGRGGVPDEPNWGWRVLRWHYTGDTGAHWSYANEDRWERLGDSAYFTHIAEWEASTPFGVQAFNDDWRGSDGHIWFTAGSSYSAIEAAASVIDIQYVQITIWWPSGLRAWWPGYWQGFPAEPQNP